MTNDGEANPGKAVVAAVEHISKSLLRVGRFIVHI